MCNTPWEYQGQIRGPLNSNNVAFLLITLVNSTLFLIHSRNFHMLYLPPTVIFTSSNQLSGFFHWNRLIQKDVWATTSSEWELYVAVKLLTNFKHLNGVSTFLFILDKKQPTYKISMERRIAIASVVGLDNLTSNLWIIILRLMTKLIFEYKSPLSASIIYMYGSMYW